MTLSTTFEPLRPDLLGEWLAFFDGPAFADHPEWRGCYCRCFLFGKAADPEAEWGRACATGENRGAMAERIAAGQVDGLLARRDGEVVGWLHFGPASRFCSMMGTTFASIPEQDGGRVGGPDQAAIVCFLVAASARRSGIARAMLREGLAQLGRRGFRSVVAWGATDAEDSAGEMFTGPLELYVSEGFEIVQPGRKRPMVFREI